MYIYRNLYKFWWQLHDCAAVANEARLKHGDISWTIFLRCNGAREYSENISTAKFFTFTVYCIVML